MSSSSHDTEHAGQQDLPDLRPYLRGGNPLLIVISGPSGAGKDAVVKRMKELGYPFHFVITATTRSPRQGEQEGVDYFFLSEKEFVDLMHRGELLEHALVYGEHKGIPKQQVRHALASGRDVVMRLDVQGAATVRALVPDALLVFLIPGSEEELLQRLHGRKTETAAELQRRVATMREEMKRISEFDYVVVNRDGQLDRAVEAVVAIMHAEKCRTKQRVIRL
jgi:guanylate kinase